MTDIDPPLPKFSSIAGEFRIRFETYEQLLSWLQDEKEQWSLLYSTNPSDPDGYLSGPNTQRNAISQAISTAERAIDISKRSPATTDYKNEIDTHRRTISNFFEEVKNGDVIISKTLVGRKILSLSSNEKDLNRLLAYLIGEQQLVAGPNKQRRSRPYPVRDIVDSAINWRMSDFNEHFVSAQRENLQKLQSDWLNWVEIAKRDHKIQEENFSKLLKKQNQEQNIWQLDGRKILEDSNEKFLDQEKLFTEKLRIAAPASYWKTQQDYHRRASVISMIISSVLIIAGIGIIAYIVVAGISHLPKNASGEPLVATIALLSVGAVLFLWLIRLASRNHGRHAALADDAELRSVMASTYLSLLQSSGTDVEPQQRLLILQALFRPPGSGQPETEAGPASLLEALLKQAQGPTGR